MEQNLHSEIWLVPTIHELVIVEMIVYIREVDTYSATSLGD